MSRAMAWKMLGLAVLMFASGFALKVTPGTSALFALTSGATAPDRVIDELKAYDFEIISTNLPEEQEQKLREAFAEE